MAKEIDYDALAKKFGAIEQPMQPEVDYDALAAQFGAEQAQPTQPSVMDSYAPPNTLQQTLDEESWLGRQAAGFGSAAAKTYYGGKQLFGGTLSPEDQQAVKDWSAIEQAAPIGSIAGNIATIALPGAGLARVPVMANVGRAMLTPSTFGKAAAVGGGYSALQPTTEQGQQGILDRGTEAAKGAIGGVLGYGAAKAGGRILSPQTSPEIQLLQREGIPTTIGQTLGGRSQATESKLTSVLGLGDLIAHKQNQGIDALNVAAYNRALSPIGEKSSGSVGFKGMEEVHKKLTDRYSDLTSKMHLTADSQLGQDLTQIRTMIDELPDQYSAMYDKMFNRLVISRMTPQGNMSGETLKSVESELGDQIASLRSGNASYEHTKIADALTATKQAIKDNLARNSPVWAKELNKLDEGWANYAIIRDAASTTTGAKGGAFTPANLAAAVRKSATQRQGQATGKGKISEGRALMQDLSSAGVNRLAPAYPDSGTAGRGVLSNMVALAAGGGTTFASGLPTTIGLAGLASVPYLSSNLTRAILTKRPDLVRQAGGRLSNLAPYGGLVGASEGSQY